LPPDATSLRATRSVASESPRTAGIGSNPTAEHDDPLTAIEAQSSAGTASHAYAVQPAFSSPTTSQRAAATRCSTSAAAERIRPSHQHVDREPSEFSRQVDFIRFAERCNLSVLHSTFTEQTPPRGLGPRIDGQSRRSNAVLDPPAHRRTVGASPLTRHDWPSSLAARKVLLSSTGSTFRRKIFARHPVLVSVSPVSRIRSSSCSWIGWSMSGDAA